MFFVPCSFSRQRNPLAMAPKKSIAVQLGWQPSTSVVPILDESGANVTTSPAGKAPPTVVPMPLAGRVDVGFQGAPSEVMEHPKMATILLPMVGR